MMRKLENPQPDLFELDEPLAVLAPAQKIQLAALIEALLLEIAAALAGGEVGDDFRYGVASAKRSVYSAAMMMWGGAAASIQWASAAPPKFVLSNATIPPICVTPSQIATYSGRLGIIRHTASPLVMPRSMAQRA